MAITVGELICCYVVGLAIGLVFVLPIVYKDLAHRGEAGDER